MQDFGQTIRHWTVGVRMRRTARISSGLQLSRKGLWMMSDRMRWSYRELYCFDEKIKERLSGYQICCLVAFWCLCSSFFEAAVVGQLAVKHPP